MVDIGGYNLANLCATFWTSEKRQQGGREVRLLQTYYATLLANGVLQYTWDGLITDYRSGLIYWILVPVQDGYDGARREYWWPRMQCLVTAFSEWGCETTLGMSTQ